MFGRLIRQPLRLVPKLTPLPILSGPMAGKRWLSTSGTHGCWLGTYERELQREIAKSLTAQSVFYDVGANVGYFSLLASGIARQVFAFEPLPRNVELFNRNMALNDVSNVALIDAAVADECGAETFAEGGASQGRLGSGALQVRVVALDEMNLPPPTHMKIDVEGAESRVLVGARRILEAAHPVIFLSGHGWRQQQICSGYLAALDYEVTVRKDGAKDGQYESIAV